MFVPRRGDVLFWISTTKKKKCFCLCSEIKGSLGKNTTHVGAEYLDVIDSDCLWQLASQGVKQERILTWMSGSEFKVVG